MDFIVNNIQWIMLVSGALTCTMAYAVVFPEAALKNTFGESVSHPVTNLVVRSWGALITLVGVMLIYSAFEPGSRVVAAWIAAASKFIWVGLVMTYGRQYLGKASVVIAFDFAVAVLLLIYLFLV